MARACSGFPESVPEKNGQTMSALIRIRAGLENIAVSKGHFCGLVPEFVEQTAIGFQTPAGKPGEQRPVFVAAGEMEGLEMESFRRGERSVLQGPAAIRGPWVICAEIQIGVLRLGRNIWRDCVPPRIRHRIWPE